MPLCRAKASLDRKRLIPAVSPMILAAVRAPQPGKARSLGAATRTRLSISCSRVRMAALSSTIRASRSRAKRATGSVRPASAAVSAAWTTARPSERGAGSATASSTRNQRRRCSWRVRSPTRSSRWSTRRRTSRSGPSSEATGRLGSRRTARATARASIGSLLPGSRPERRAPAISLGETRTTDSPARTSSASSRRDRWRQSSRPTPLGPSRRPAAELEVARVRRGDRLLGQLATRCIDHDDGVTPLVQIRAQDDHVCVSSSSEVTPGRSADTPESGRSHAPIKSRRPVHRVSRPAKRMEATPTGWAGSIRARP